MFRFLLFFLIVVSLSQANIIQKFSNPNNCMGCHKDQVDDWNTAWHSNSHELKNSLFKKTITQLENKTHKPRADIILSCGKCHNPRLEIKEIEEDYMFAKAFGIQTESTTKTDKAINAKHVQNGISCYVCHNIDMIYSKKTPQHAGSKIIKWITTDTIAGPFPPNDRARFHKSAQRAHFIRGNKLCLTCHQGAGNENDFSIYNTGEEIKDSKSKQRCVECHMSSKREGVIAPHITLRGEEPQKRKIRSHLFAGARNSNILESALQYSMYRSSNNIKVYIENLIPHNVPTGFSGRSIVVKVAFKNNEKEISNQLFTLRAIYMDKNNRETLSYLATEKISDTRLKPLEKRMLELKIPKNANSVEISSWYYLVSPSLQDILEIEDSTFTKKYPILKKSFDLK